MDNTPNEQEVSTETQRQALDAMSGELLDKLNRMIEEQNARVQDFATQYPQAAAPAPEPVTYRAPQPEPPAAQPAAQPRPTHSVTPPPAATPRAATPPPVRPQQHTPAAKAKPAASATDKGENSIGCGKLVFIIAIIVILLRCCN